MVVLMVQGAVKAMWLSLVCLCIPHVLSKLLAYLRSKRNDFPDESPDESPVEMTVTNNPVIGNMINNGVA